MDDFCDLVGKHHHFGLKNLRRGAKVANAEDSHYALALPARHHGVDASGVGSAHVLTDDVCSGFAEAQSKQRSKLDDCFLEDHGLHDFFSARRTESGGFHRKSGQRLLLGPLHTSLFDLLGLELVIGHFHRQKRLVANGLDAFNHLFDGPKHESIRVAGEHERRRDEQDHHEEGHRQAERCHRSIEGAQIKVEGQVEGLLRTVRPKAREIRLDLRETQVQWTSYLVKVEAADVVVEHREAHEVAGRRRTLLSPGFGDHSLYFRRQGPEVREQLLAAEGGVAAGVEAIHDAGVQLRVLHAASEIRAACLPCQADPKQRT
mmetsp:Transcript_397/g.1101  ORF Transcript_397/g.1101 Transcript_397/m.1101 type:complete len:318 (-) Transcript_397:1170-2123(-)